MKWPRYAAFYGSLDVYRILILDGRFDILDTDNDRLDALNAAIEAEHKDIVSYLLGLNLIDPGTLDTRGASYLHYATHFGSEIVSVLALGF